MDKSTSMNISHLTAAVMIVLAGLLLFSVKVSSWFFSLLPNTEGWLRTGTYFPYLLIVMGVVIAAMGRREHKINARYNT